MIFHVFHHPALLEAGHHLDKADKPRFWVDPGLHHLCDDAADGGALFGEEVGGP